MELNAESAMSNEQLGRVTSRISLVIDQSAASDTSIIVIRLLLGNSNILLGKAKL